jgi:hypothetical protein
MQPTSKIVPQSQKRWAWRMKEGYEGAQMAENKGIPFVGIAGVIGGISIAIVTVIAVLARDQLAIAAWIVGALAIMGIGLGFFASRMSKPN